MNWLLMPLLLLCLSACSSADDNNVATSQTEDTSKTKLYIYVYAPQEAQSSRAYEGDVDPITNESSGLLCLFSAINSEYCKSLRADTNDYRRDVC